MKLAGFLLLSSGWAIVAAAASLLPSSGAAAPFVLSGIAVEILGLALAAYAHRTVFQES